MAVTKPYVVVPQGKIVNEQLGMPVVPWSVGTASVSSRREAMKFIGLGPKGDGFHGMLGPLVCRDRARPAKSPTRQVQCEKCREILQTTAGLRMTVVGGCANR